MLLVGIIDRIIDNGGLKTQTDIGNMMRIHHLSCTGSVLLPRFKTEGWAKRYLYI